MQEQNEIIKSFLHILILQVDIQGNVKRKLLDASPYKEISNANNLYDLFSKEDGFRLKRVLEMPGEIKKYMAFNKKFKINELVDVRSQEIDGDVYVCIQFFESNRAKEIMDDRLLDKLISEASKDPLTQILNRRGLNEKLQRMIEKSDHKKRLGIMYIDMDKLKYINDTFGHKEGSKAISMVSKTLSTISRSRDIISRVGGDEFVAIIEEITGEKSTAYGFAKRFLRTLRKEQEDNTKYKVSASVGIHILEVEKLQKFVKNEEKFVEKLNIELSKADKGTYTSKKNGGNQITVTSDFMQYYPVYKTLSIVDL